jgi:hypothetical protein
MEDNKFKEMAEMAIMGDRNALNKIIEIYMPQIRNASIDYQTKKIDEDCMSTIIENLLVEIKKFKKI